MNQILVVGGGIAAIVSAGVFVYNSIRSDKSTTKE